MSYLDSLNKYANPNPFTNMREYGSISPQNYLTGPGGGFDVPMPNISGGDMGFAVPDMSSWSNPVASAAIPTNRGIMDSFLQQKYADGSTGGGYGSVGISLAQGLGSAYMGMQQYKLAKESLAASKDQFNKNYTAQKQTTNAALEDRQRARIASNAGAYESLDSYMKKNGIQ